MVRGGIEPPTQGFSVPCSTNWATAPSKDNGWIPVTPNSVLLLEFYKRSAEGADFFDPKCLSTAVFGETHYLSSVWGIWTFTNYPCFAGHLHTGSWLHRALQEYAMYFKSYNSSECVCFPLKVDCIGLPNTFPNCDTKVRTKFLTCKYFWNFFLFFSKNNFLLLPLQLRYKDKNKIFNPQIFPKKNPNFWFGLSRFLSFNSDKYLQ